MKSIQKLKLASLNWARDGQLPGVRALFAGEEKVGELYFAKDDDTHAEAFAEDGHWTFICTRYILPRVSVRTPKLGFLATFEGSRSGNGMLEFLGGKRYHWLCTDIWQTTWGFETMDRTPLVRFQSGYEKDNSGGLVEITPAAWEHPNLSLLVLLGWYLSLLNDTEDSAIPVDPEIIRKKSTLLAN